jgi:hypothetical protein
MNVERHGESPPYPTVENVSTTVTSDRDSDCGSVSKTRIPIQ